MRHILLPCNGESICLFCFQYFAFGKIMRKYFFLLKNIEQNHSVCFPIQWIFPL
ncbi:hypothetical protein JCM10003_2307 [Bacteroides pyogenes JCM 10003]|nr:hypothetical protein JCM10003_2307 [Bacteroides pyogenes JCM 10003]